MTVGRRNKAPQEFAFLQPEPDAFLLAYQAFKRKIPERNTISAAVAGNVKGIAVPVDHNLAVEYFKRSHSVAEGLCQSSFRCHARQCDLHGDHHIHVEQIGALVRITPSEGMTII